jgi:hypothetical protein
MQVIEESLRRSSPPAFTPCTWRVYGGATSVKTTTERVAASGMSAINRLYLDSSVKNEMIRRVISPSAGRVRRRLAFGA